MSSINNNIYLKNASEYESQIINLESLRAIANKVSEELERKLTKLEGGDLINFVRDQKTYNWKGVAVPDIRYKLAKIYIQNKFTPAGRVNKEQKSDIVDIHEF